MKFQIDIAGKRIEINSIYDRVYAECKDYLVDASEPDFVITTSENDIDCEVGKLEDRDRFFGDNKEGDVRAYLENLAVFRKIAAQIVQYDIFLMHGSVVGVGDECFMITGSSGSGKTTRSKLVLSNIPGSYIVNGDKPFLKVTDSAVYACGTPWCGKERYNTNAIVPLKAIFILERSEINRITELSFKDAFQTLFRQTYRPKETEGMLKTLNLLNQLERHVRFFKLESNREPDVAALMCKAAFN